MESDREKFLDMLKEFDTAMLVTRRGSDRLDARPMAIADLEETGDLWFITSEETLKLREIADNPRVQITCQNERDKYLWASGIAYIIQNREKVHELWKEPYKVWFTEGKDDPRIRLINVRLDEGEYWDNRGANKAKLLFEAAKAYVTGQRPPTEDPDTHGQVQL